MNLKNLTKLVIFSFGLYFGCHTIDELKVSGVGGAVCELSCVKYYNQYDLMGQILDKVKAEKPDLRGLATLLVGREHLEDLPITGDQELLSVTLVLNQLEFKVLSGYDRYLFVEYGDRVYYSFIISSDQTLNPEKTYTMQEVSDMKSYIILDPSERDDRPVASNERSIFFSMAFDDLLNKISHEQEALKEKYERIRGADTQDYYQQVPHAFAELNEGRGVTTDCPANDKIINEILTKLELPESSSEKFVVGSVAYAYGIYTIHLSPIADAGPGYYTLDEMVKKFKPARPYVSSKHILGETLTSLSNFDELNPEQSRLFFRLLMVVQNIPIKDKSDEEKMLENRIQVLGTNKIKMRESYYLSLQNSTPGNGRVREEMMAKIKRIAGHLKLSYFSQS